MNQFQVYDSLVYLKPLLLNSGSAVRVALQILEMVVLCSKR